MIQTYWLVVRPDSRGSLPSSSLPCLSSQSGRTCCRSSRAGGSFARQLKCWIIKTSHHDSAWKLLIRKRCNIHAVSHQSAYFVPFPSPGSSLRRPHGAPFLPKFLTFLADDVSLTGRADGTLDRLLFRKDKVGLGRSILPLL